MRRNHPTPSGLVPLGNMFDMFPLPFLPPVTGPSDGVNHRRHMRLVIIGRDRGRQVATYVPKGKPWPQPGRPLGMQEAARRRRQQARQAQKLAEAAALSTVGMTWTIAT